MTLDTHPLQLVPPDLRRWADTPVGVPYLHERDSGTEGPDLLITALVHGNEYSGAIAMQAFLAAGIWPRRGRITVAFCNVAAFGRFDAKQPDASRYLDEDFNRVWSPQILDGPRHSAELDRARVLRPFVDRATHLLDLHSMHEHAAPLLVTGMLDRNIAFAQSLATADQAMVDEGHANGVRMRDYGGFAEAAGARIALLLEAGQHWQAASLEVCRNVVMRFMLRAGSLDRADVPAGWLLPDAAPPPPIRVLQRVVARSMDFRFTQPFRGGEIIARAGTPIAHDGGVPVLTPFDHCVLVMPSLRQLKPGVTTVRLGVCAAE